MGKKRGAESRRLSFAGEEELMDSADADRNRAGLCLSTPREEKERGCGQKRKSVVFCTVPP
jgi:hypothetical protein